MSPDKLFALLAMICLLLWLLPSVIPIGPRGRAMMLRAAYLLLGGGIVAAVALAALQLLA